MTDSFARSLRQAFFRPTRPLVAEPAAGSSGPPTLQLTTYSGDCRASGRITLLGDRLTDMLNALDEFELIDVLVESLEDGHAIRADDLVVGREEMCAVHVTGPRGDQGRRVRTRPTPIGIHIAPYAVAGYLHVLPGSDPIAAFRHGRTMVPLTGAWIEYDSANGRQHARAETLVVNRNRSDRIELVGDEDLRR